MNYIFIDDAGDKNFNNSSTKSLGMTGIVIASGDIELVRQNLEAFFSKHNLSSKTFKWGGFSEKYRLAFINEVVAQSPIRPINYNNVKAEHLSPEAIQRYQSNSLEYYMNLVDGLAGLLSTNLNNTASIIHDTYGRPENQNQIEGIYRSAFNTSGVNIDSFQFESQTNEPLLILADIVGGFLRRLQETSAQGNPHADLLLAQQVLTVKNPIVIARMELQFG